MKQTNKIILTIFLFFIILISFLLYRYLTINQRKAPTKTEGTPSRSIPTPTFEVVRKPEQLPVIKKDETTGKEIIEIPFNYVVKSADQEKIVLQIPGGGERDIITYPQRLFNVIKVFKQSASGTSEGKLSDIAVGQSIKVRNINRGERIEFYIIQ
jgi:hypothetical protein